MRKGGVYVPPRPCPSPPLGSDFCILRWFTTYGASADWECLHYANHFLPAQTSRDQSMSIPAPSSNQCHCLSYIMGSNRKTLFSGALHFESGWRDCLKCSHPTLYHTTLRWINAREEMKADSGKQWGKITKQWTFGNFFGSFCCFTRKCLSWNRMCMRTAPNTFTASSLL